MNCIEIFEVMFYEIPPLLCAACFYYQCSFSLFLLLIKNVQKLKLNLEAMAIRNSHVLELKDVSFSIAKEMIKFIYTGSVTPEFLEHRGIDLLQAAHKVLTFT